VEDKERARCAETASLIKMKKKNQIKFFGWFSFLKNKNENKFLKPKATELISLVTKHPTIH
jgi:hypothetical protein